MTSRPESTQPVIQPPLSVRLAGSVLLGLAVATMAMPLSNGIKVIILILAVGGAMMFTFSHPYRRDVRAEVEKRGERYRTSVNQIMPLFPLWLGLMILPAFALNSWVIALVVAVIAGGYAWMVYPHIDGTKHIRPLQN
ncbi:hypothetical protein [uncultured Corynebacterium sp.]|uniref:hypothetical protein n=1 Tax=uncultured Corynebacterium sp. TaxID=159447 RepID=UPI0025CDE9C2|nr:hypothetical protein [uncultured Corynebacterium sp.]